MGEVFCAQDLSLDRVVAVKVLPEQFVNEPERLARFQSEAKALAALSHPNILSIYDVGSEQGVPYAVTELLKGQTLRSRLTPAPLSWRKAVEVATSIADGLAAAHARGIVHRDLKPANVFLTDDGQTKILDFGLAHVDRVAEPTAETGTFLTDQTVTGAVMGTVGYMSPEQIRGR